ncbi:MAG: hypothetical protein KDD34_06410 [Bdellovibrionales bacterium]|nr:hypothetical protein [Bdellovibrionales bacterium]
MKGKRGIVEFPNRGRFKNGDVIRIDDGVWQEKGLDGNGKRNYSIALSASIGQTKETSKTTLTTNNVDHGEMQTEVAFGFNFRWNEFGPLISYLISKVDDEQTTTSSIGGFYRYNFKENKPGAEWVPYAGLAGSLISQDSDNTKRDGLGFRIMGGTNIFPLNDHVSLLVEGRFDYSTLKSDNTESTSTGFTLAFGISSYF